MMCQQTIGFLGLCAVLLASCSGFDDDSLRRIKKAGEIRIAMSSDYPPFSYYNEKKVLDGFDVDVAREIARRLGVTLKPVMTKWTEKIQGLLNGEIDAVLGCVAVTKERLKVLRFSAPYYHSATQLMIRDGAAFKTPEELAGKSIGAVAGTTFEDDARKLGPIDLRIYQGHSKAFRDLHNGVLDGMVTDRVVGDNAIRSGKFDIQFLGSPLRNRKVAMGLRKEDKALLSKIESVLKDMRKEGVLQTLIKKVAQCEYNCAAAF
jgi:polar amino acid transport system substrate-binding protein